MTALLKAEDLTIKYRTDAEPIIAVSNASFTINKSEYFGLVGESGCGKSTIAKSIIGALDDNGYISSGKLWYKGEEIQHLSQSALNERIRWKEISLIPQSSMNNLDPLERIKDQALEIAGVHTDRSKGEILEELRELFEIVGLPPSRVSDYPHQFSGGMQQRAIIALALILNPSLIVADEPTTALDVVMQDQVFEHLLQIQEEMETSMLLITHDISLVFETCDRMAVMHAGQIAESGTVTAVYDSPHHPYTIQLQRAFPDIRYPERKLETIEGTPPQNRGEMNYCTFVDRCPWAEPACDEFAPEHEPIETDESVQEGHFAACHRKEEMPQLRTEQASSPVERRGDLDDR